MKAAVNTRDLGVFDAMRKARAANVDPLRLMTCDGEQFSLAGLYRGRSVFLVCGGPSLNQIDTTKMHGRGIVSMGVNNSWLSHRPNMWVAVDTPRRFADVGWKDPGITKFVPAKHRAEKLGVMVKRGDGEWKRRESAFCVHQMPNVLLFQRTGGFNHETFLSEPGACWGCEVNETCSLGIKSKRSVMMVAIRLLHYLGFGKVFIVGADFNMTKDSPYAFGQARTDKNAEYNNDLYDVLNKRFKAIEPLLRERGCKVYNATPGGNLTAFERISYDDAITVASNECIKEVPADGWYVG